MARQKTSATDAPELPAWSRRNILNPRSPLSFGSPLDRMTRVLKFAYTTTQADVAWNMMRTPPQWRNRVTNYVRPSDYDLARARDLIAGAVEDIADRPKPTPAAAALDEALIAALEEIAATIEEK